MLLSIAGLYSTAQDYLRFAQMLANGGQLDGVRILSPTSVKLMTSNLLADGVPMHFDQPFAGVGYGMELGIVLDPARADFNGGAIGAGSFYWGGVHGTWFWVDPSTTSSSSAWSSRRRRQPGDGAALSRARHPRDIAVHHLRGAGRPRALVRNSSSPAR